MAAQSGRFLSPLRSVRNDNYVEVWEGGGGRGGCAATAPPSILCLISRHSDQREESVNREPPLTPPLHAPAKPSFRPAEGTDQRELTEANLQIVRRHVVYILWYSTISEE